MKIIVNSTPIIALSLINQLDLLAKLFDEVIIPNAVYQEIIINGRGKIGARELKQADWIQVQSVTQLSGIEPILLGLDQGELEVILLAISLKPDWVILDEKLGRKVAQIMNLPVKGTVGILLTAFYLGYLSKQEILNFLPVLINNGIRLSPKIITKLQEELDR